MKRFLVSHFAIIEVGFFLPLSVVVPGEGVRHSGSHKRRDQMEFCAQGESWAVMTARDYYITAQHEIDPLYTNKTQRRLYLKCFLITWCNCSEEKTNEGRVYGTVGLVGDGNL